ncbi:MAG: hypothetical protein R2879_04650 [Saprospiraceae bacterium]
MTKSLKTSIILSIAFIGLLRLRPIWERNPGGLWNLIFYLSIASLFIWISIKILIEIYKIHKNRSNLKWTTFLPIVILLIGLLDGLYNPLKLNLENIYGEVTFRACYEGTQNQATFKLRKPDRFEIHWTGVFFYDEFFVGTYSKSGDTLLLNYKGKKPGRIGDKILMDDKNEILQTIRTDDDNLEYVDPFYYGYCKGLN